MAERISITLPESLYQRLQAVKDRLNVSGICQAAIEHAVEIEEIKMKDIPAKEKAIERLRLERQKTEDKWFDCGKADGLKDAEDLSYENFEEILDLYNYKDDLQRGGFWVDLDQLPEDLHDLLEERMKKYSPRPVENIYLDGWVDGVTDFWYEIQNKI